MKVKKLTEDEWDIMLDDKVVGRITHHYSFIGSRGGYKVLYVNSKKIDRVANQKEAIGKLEKFFAKNKEDIVNVQKLIDELVLGISQVNHQICIDTLNVERRKQMRILEELESYDLI